MVEKDDFHQCLVANEFWSAFDPNQISGSTSTCGLHLSLTTLLKQISSFVHDKKFYTLLKLFYTSTACLLPNGAYCDPTSGVCLRPTRCVCDQSRGERRRSCSGLEFLTFTLFKTENILYCKGICQHMKKVMGTKICPRDL